MLIIRGVNVFPTQIEELILREPRLAPHYQIELTRSGHLDAMCVRVEVKPDVSLSDTERRNVARSLVHHIKSNVGISVEVAIQNPHEIARSVGKAQHVIDKRKASS